MLNSSSSTKVTTTMSTFMANENENELQVWLWIKGVYMLATVNNLDTEDAYLIAAELEDGTPVDVESIKPEDFIQGVFDWHADWV
jgi:hypothetical protein